MGISRKLRVLVVDDSMLFREILSRGLSSETDIEVITAIDPFDARDKIIKYEPDVMTCDIEMPKMNGIEFVRRLIPQYPIPVIVVSTISEAVLDAIRVGAVDFITKPSVRSVSDVENFINELIIKIRIVSSAKVSHNIQSQTSQKVIGKMNFSSNKVIAIGASTGGTEAIYKIIKCLPSNIPGIVIVQHIPPVFSKMFADRLNAATSLEVMEAQSGQFLEPGRVLVAPGDKHMRIKRLGERYKVECFEGDKVNGHCPSVDVLFESVAKEAGKNAMGVILTGMGYDGAKGLLAMKRKGARTIGQDEGSSVVFGMPKVALNIGAVERQAALDKIPQLICSMLD